MTTSDDSKGEEVADGTTNMIIHCETMLSKCTAWFQIQEEADATQSVTFM